MAQKDPYGDMIKSAQKAADPGIKFAKHVEKTMKKAGFTKR